jgi:hypothetical protein
VVVTGGSLLGLLQTAYYREFLYGATYKHRVVRLCQACVASAFFLALSYLFERDDARSSGVHLLQRLDMMDDRDFFRVVNSVARADDEDPVLFQNSAGRNSSFWQVFPERTPSPL